MIFAYFLAAISLVCVVAFVLLYLLWFFYLAVMSINQAQTDGTLKSAAKKLAWPIALLGTWLDYFVQYTVATAIFLERPKEPTLSGRVARLIATGSGWRKRLAVWFRDTLLKPFDKSGAHG